MANQEVNLTVSFVDRERQTIYLEIDGCPVTVACTEQRNNGMRGILKEILIGSLVKDNQLSHNCVGA